MKQVYLIGGTMGVGKTSVCQLLKEDLKDAVFLDGDWCWDADPFYITDETKRMVMDNICYLLNRFIECSVYENIIFCWVMHQQQIIDEICHRINITNCDVKIISLVCDEQVLIQRLEKDVRLGIRKKDIIERSLDRLTYYNQLETTKIDVSNLSIEEVKNEILKL